MVYYLRNMYIFQQHWSSLTQIEACLITCQQQNFIESCLAQAFKEQELEYLKASCMPLFSSQDCNLVMPISIISVMSLSEVLVLVKKWKLK